MRIVPPSHFLPLLAPLGLLPAGAATAVATASARAATLSAAVDPPSTAAARAVTGVAGAPGTFPALCATGTAACRPAVGHFFHQVQGGFRIDMFVRVNRVGPPTRIDRLCHLLLAVAAPADQFKAVNDNCRRHGFPEMEFELGEVTQNRQQKFWVVVVSHVTGIVTAWRSNESRPWGKHKDRVCAALRRDSFS